MHDPFSPTPFLHYVKAYNLLTSPRLKILDYGCGFGNFIGEVAKTTRFAYGYDVDPDKINQASLNYPSVNFNLGKVDQPLPYPDRHFDVVTLFHVLEHVDSEIRVISEIHRVLKKDGLLILASPYKGLFAWADAANLRYRFPQFHRWAFQILLGQQEYTKRFKHPQLLGMCGDSTASRKWHTHYTEKELRRLLATKFAIIKIEKFSFFYPFVLIPYNIINYFFNPKFNPLVWLIHLDSLINAGDLSYNFLIVASKK